MLNFKVVTLIFVMLSSVLFTGCTELQKSEQIKVKIVDIKPPKHFYIIISVDGTKQDIKISKRCQVKDNLIGSETIITKKTYIDKKSGKISYSYSSYLPKEEYCN